MKRLSFLLLFLFLAGCHAAPQGVAKERPAPVVQTVWASIGTVLRTLPVTGSLAPLPNHEAKVNAPFAGALASVLTQPDQAVAKGQLVAQMSTQPLLGQIQQAEATVRSAQIQEQQATATAQQQQAAGRAAIAQAQAQLTGAKAVLANAAQNLQRQQKLFNDGLVAQKDVDDARLAVQTAGATVGAQEQSVAAARAAVLTDIQRNQNIAIAHEQVENASGALATARSEASLAAIHAPLSGTVASVTANNGEVVDTTTTLMTIVDMRDLQLWVAVPGRSLRLVHAGEPVRFTTDSLPGKSFVGVVQSIGAQVDPTTGTVSVLVRIPNSSRLLKDNMAVTGEIVVEQRSQALLVPKSALLTDSSTNQTSVVVVGSDSIAHVRPVEVGLSSGDKIEITKGLLAGEQVAVAGQYALPDGAKVSIQDAGTKNAP